MVQDASDWRPINQTNGRNRYNAQNDTLPQFNCNIPELMAIVDTYLDF